MRVVHDLCHFLTGDIGTRTHLPVIITVHDAFLFGPVYGRFSPIGHGLVGQLLIITLLELFPLLIFLLVCHVIIILLFNLGFFSYVIKANPTLAHFPPARGSGAGCFCGYMVPSRSHSPYSGVIRSGARTDI